MKRDEALTILKSQMSLLQSRFGVKRAGLFGSVARDEAGADSDIDIVVEMAPDLFLMVHAKEALEAAFHAPVDLVRYRERMNPFLKKRIDQEAVYA
ncbi:MAG: nucleotidyltransferase family protein [Campylobacterales bacterium]